MNLAEMLVDMRLELSDSTTFFTDGELTRGVQKCVSLMSRFIPKRVITEATITIEVTGETLTISSNSGTLSNKPVKVGTLNIPNKTLDTNYTINYLTGVVTEKGSGLPDTDYTVSYNLDPFMLDISSLIPEESYIKIEKIEYPAGDSPPTIVTFEVFGELLLIKGKNVQLNEDSHIRITYLKPWTAPVTATDGDYPEHLDNIVIIGSVGQALIFKAEKYIQEAITNIAASKTALDAVSAITMTSAPDVSTDIGKAGTALDAAITRFAAAVTEVAKMDSPLANSATALGKVAARVAAGLTYIELGDDLITTINDAASVPEKYASYAQTEVALGLGYTKESDGEVALATSWEAKAAREMAIGNSYTNEAIQRLASASRDLEKYQIQVSSDSQEVAYYNAQLAKASQYQTTSRQYVETAGRYLASGQAKINEFLISLGVKPEFLSHRSSSEQFS